jgi:hypothetical protein
MIYCFIHLFSRRMVSCFASFIKGLMLDRSPDSLLSVVGRLAVESILVLLERVLLFIFNDKIQLYLYERYIYEICIHD